MGWIAECRYDRARVVQRLNHQQNQHGASNPNFFTHPDQGAGASNLCSLPPGLLSYAFGEAH